MTREILLEVDHLKVDFASRAGLVQAISDVSLTVHKGETLGLVGESGSGKSVSAQAVAGLISSPGTITGGDIRWRGQSLLGRKGERYARSVRGKNIAMIFQDPMTSLNPLMTIGNQLGEGMRYHLGYSHAQARKRAEELLGAVGLSAPARRLDQYPHELSGGMRQRVMIAMAISCEPELLIADEPTTALDVTIQAQILELLASLQQQLGLAIILITHDLGVVAGLCARVAVMYAGRIVETGDVDTIFETPGHPYTQGLLRSTPSLEGTDETLLSIEGMPPSLINPPPGCAFLPRCPIGTDHCRKAPPMQDWNGSVVRCWKAGTNAWLPGVMLEPAAGL
ncbi:ABC transporter ATP-binding protein [Pelagibacterium lacus]|uniref:ABC transporter ATP-binding protein n=1 Tax=Pelagibacterium lacus TaxID=2282655 RepID=A0A369W9Y6_9HYPH|nr:ABC transporter ATP-binding protein [Pelagibacterium lacus]RDE08881.1 ABC transporter ATP-binding protein [Pelagibacterium lacus]